MVLFEALEKKSSTHTHHFISGEEQVGWEPEAREGIKLRGREGKKESATAPEPRFLFY